MAPKKQNDFAPPVGAAREFERQLRHVARHTAGIIKPHIDGPRIVQEALMMDRIRAYAKVLGPWADSYVRRFNVNLDEANKRAFKKTSVKVAQAMRAEARSPLGLDAERIHREQVTLIKSLPLEAAQRAQTLAREATFGGKRPAEIAQELADTEGITLNRATLIARTEIGKAYSAMTQARAESIGSPGYYWVATKDARTRQSHADMDGVFVAWDDPPELDDMTGHAGTLPNCRCRSRVDIPE